MTVTKIAALTRFTAAAAFTVLAVSSANAAEAAKADTASTSAEGIETVSDTNATDGTKMVAPATTSLQLNTSVPASTSTASLPQEIQAASPRHIFGQFYTQTYEDLQGLKQARTSPVLDSFVAVKYDLGNDRSVAIRQNFDYRGAASAGSGDFHIQDIALNYADGKLATFANGATLTFIGRVYLPTGESSRLSGDMGKERIYLIAAKSFGKFDLAYNFVTQLNNNTRDTYFRPKAGGLAETQNLNFFVLSEIDAMYNVSDKFAAGVAAGNQVEKNRVLAGKSDQANTIYLEPIVLQFSPVKGIALSAALIDNLEVQDPTAGIQLMRDDQLQAYFNFAYSL